MSDERANGLEHDADADDPADRAAVLRDALIAEQRRISTVFVLGIVLFPALGGLDVIAYPQHLEPLMVIRGLIVVSVCLALLGIGRVRSLFGTVLISSVAFALAGLGIAAMVGVTEGAASPYYVGICLTITCASVLFAWPLAASISVYSIVLSGYGIAVWVHPGSVDVRQLAINLFFLLPTAGIGVIGTVVRGQLGRRELEARLALAKSNAQLSRMARHDALTGLRNRRGLAEKLREALSLNKRFGVVSTAAMIDLDNFKAVNDTLGHTAGDDLLKRIGEALTSTTRETDFVYRVGGDEFLIIFQNSDADACALALRRIQACIRVITDEPQLARLRVGISIGVVQIIYAPGELETEEDVIARADGLMYLAKRRGRDRAAGGSG